MISVSPAAALAAGAAGAAAGAGAGAAGAGAGAATFGAAAFGAETAPPAAAKYSFQSNLQCCSYDHLHILN